MLNFNNKLIMLSRILTRSTFTPNLICHNIIRRQLMTTIPRATTQLGQNEDYATIYKLPFIRGIGIINRLKLYYTGLSIAAIPGTYLAQNLNYGTEETVVFTAILIIGGLFPLYTLGFFVNQLVGIIYYNKKNNIVKIAHLDFWGNRRDVAVELNDIVPISDNSKSITDPLYSKCYRYSTKDKFKICTKYGIVDYDTFNKIFVQPF